MIGYAIAGPVGWAQYGPTWISDDRLNATLRPASPVGTAAGCPGWLGTAMAGLGALHLALVLADAVLATNLVLRPLAYRIHPALPEAIPIETLYEVKLHCETAVAAHIRTLLLSAGDSAVHS
jgi:hypothetical protein